MRMGLDLGSTAAKALLLGADGRVVDTALDTVNVNPAKTAEELARLLLARNGVEKAATVATGYGRSLAGNAGRQITEISCHARGVRHLHPDAATILDIGGQDAKAIRLGKDGAVEDFAMNDRCAAGTGRFLEVAARRYGMEVADLSLFCDNDPRGRRNDEDGEDGGANGDPAPVLEISSTCVVFAESELVGLNARGVPAKEALRAVHRAIARRVLLLLKQVGAKEPVYFTGGVARNETLRRAIADASGMAVVSASLPQFTGALGAALFARSARHRP